MKNGRRLIFCPSCNQKVGSYDGRSTTNRVAKCKKCNKLVVYDIKNEKCELKPIPERMQGSGMRFY